MYKAVIYCTQGIFFRNVIIVFLSLFFSSLLVTETHVVHTIRHSCIFQKSIATRRLLERVKVVGRYDDSSPAFAKLHFFSCLYLLFVQLLPTTLLLCWDASSGRAWKSQIPRLSSRPTLSTSLSHGERNSTIKRR